MATLKGFRVIPPGGWRYTQPETGVQFVGVTYEGLCAEVMRHRVYKRFSVDGIDLDIQRQLCAGLSSEYCRPEDGEALPPPP